MLGLKMQFLLYVTALSPICKCVLRSTAEASWVAVKYKLGVDDQRSRLTSVTESDLISIYIF